MLSVLTRLVDRGIVPYTFVKGLDNVEDIVKKVLESALWWTYSIGIIESGEKGDVDRMKAIRNFAAHAGTERNVTLLKVENGELFIGYYRPAVDKIAREL